MDRYVENVVREIAARAVEFSTGVRTIYLGGGTPSKLGGEGIAALLHGIREYGGVDKFSPEVREVTVEANPEDVSADVVRAWRAAGANRVSLGVQSFDPANNL